MEVVLAEFGKHYSTLVVVSRHDTTTQFGEHYRNMKGTCVPLLLGSERHPVSILRRHSRYGHSHSGNPILNKQCFDNISCCNIIFHVFFFIHWFIFGSPFD
jgi:hypothetical protein